MAFKLTSSNVAMGVSIVSLASSAFMLAGTTAVKAEKIEEHGKAIAELKSAYADFAGDLREVKTDVKWLVEERKGKPR